MKLHFEEQNLSKKQERGALTSNSEETALSCVMAKKTNERGSDRKLFDILLNRFDLGVQGNQVMAKLEKRRQRDDETIEKFLDDLELLRRRSNPDERKKLSHILEVHGRSKEWCTEDHVGRPLHLVSALRAHARCVNIFS